MMSDDQKQALMEMGEERLHFNCALAPRTTFRIGGDAEVLYLVRDLKDLCRVMAYLDREGLPLLILGRGSNLLIRDKGVEGVVLMLGEAFSVIEQEPRNEEILMVGGSANLGKLLAFCQKNGLSGLEFLAGIPGSVGGAVFMNAGAYGREIGERIKKIVMVTPRGELVTRPRSRLSFSYRHLDLPRGSVIVTVCFQLTKDKPEIIAERLGGYLKERKNSQPLEYPSAGSVFKNPAGDYAGRLIEKAGLKGVGIGDAMISPKHANWIINRGRARAEDVLSLIDLVRKKVQEQTGILLETEIKVIGIE